MLRRTTTKYKDLPFALNYLAVVADRLYRCSNFHDTYSLAPEQSERIR